ncbi:MAG: sugar ABC transporter permease [Acidimicrobiia bacterium]|nr:sugar ABC transporter permease [Acidimicrobiia bacterium]
MSGSLQLVLSLIVGAAIGVLSFGYRTPRQAALGGALGVLGAGAISAALGFCMYAADAESTEGVLGIALGAAFAWMFGAGTRAVLNRPGEGSGVGGGGFGESEIRTGAYRLGWWWPWLLLSPTLVILVFFLYWPAFQTFRLSTKLTRLGAPRVGERCLANFSELLVPQPILVATLPLVAVGLIWGIGLWQARSSPDSVGYSVARTLRPVGPLVLLLALYFIFEDVNGGYRRIYLNTVIISVGTVALSMAFGLGLAYLTFRRIRGITVYRTLLIWPYAVSPPIAGILFFMIFNATGGVVAALSSRWGIDFPDYTQNATLARMTIVLASVWKLLGYNLLFFLAGLQTVPRDQIEAAALDGANAWQRFRTVVVPALGPISFFLLITNLTYSFFDVYGTIDFLTKGAPAGATSVAIYEIIRVGVDNGDLGRGAAQSVVLFLAVIALTAWQFKQSEGRINYGGA